MTVKNWPKDYPKHLVLPPDDAKSINEKLYRLVENKTPNLTDFLASYKDPMQKHLVKHKRHRNNSKFYGVSFFKTNNGIQNIIDSSPERFKAKKIAVGQVDKQHGVSNLGESSHVTVWLYENVYPKGFIWI